MAEETIELGAEQLPFSLEAEHRWEKGVFTTSLSLEGVEA